MLLSVLTETEKSAIATLLVLTIIFFPGFLCFYLLKKYNFYTYSSFGYFSILALLLLFYALFNMIYQITNFL